MIVLRRNSCIHFRVNFKFFLSKNMTTNATKPVIEKYPTIQTLSTQLAAKMGVERGFKLVPTSREPLQKLIPQKRELLPERTMKDSFTIASIPLATNHKLQEIMVSLTGHLRVNKFLEDMDIFSVIVAQNFIDNPLVGPNDHSPFTIVTALVNRIDFTDYEPKIHSDIRMCGHVTWVGQSSVEVIVWLDQWNDNKYNRITKALFLLAIRDAINSKAAFINRLKVTSATEDLIVREGLTRKKLRMQIKKADLTKVMPTQDEQKIIHDIYVKTIPKIGISLRVAFLPEGGIWMGDCTLSTVVHAQPIDRNLHSTVFGGYIMRIAVDLSYNLTRIFSHARPMLKSINDITFARPVHLNTLMMIFAQVAYTEKNYVQVIVYLQVYDLQENAIFTTNSFHMTYQVAQTVKVVYPNSYSEAMMYIAGRRHFLRYIQSDGDQPFDFEPIQFDQFDVPAGDKKSNV